MSDAEAEAEALLTDLEARQKASHRVFRRTTVLAAGAFVLLALLDAGLVLLGSAFIVRDPWLQRNLLSIGGLTVLGTMGHLGAARAYRSLVMRDTELLAHMRNEVRLATAVDEVRPLMAAIEEAREKGVSLLIPPGSFGGGYWSSAPPDDEHTVH